MTTSTAGPPTRRLRWPLATYWMRRAVMLEVWGYLSILRFFLRRRRVPAGAAAFSYHQLVMPLLVVFIVVSAIELVVVDVLVRRWPSVRIAMLVLGIWGLVWMFGMLFGFLTRPHAVGPDGIRVRSGAELDLALPWDRIESVARHKRTNQDKQPPVTTDEHGRRVFHLRMQNETNIEIRLLEPVTVRRPHGPEAVTKVDLYADQPQAFQDEVRRHRAALVSPAR